MSARAGRATRRGVLAGAAAAALAACSRDARSQDEPVGPLPPLKQNARFPVGCAVTTDHLADAAYAALLAREFSQVTPEWQMKMEYILQDDGSLRFDAPDAIAAFAKANGMGLFAHTLVWYAQSPAAFQRLDGQGAAFGKAYDDYIAAVAGRYRDAAGWDVVNEAVAEEGEGLRACLWSKNLGQIDYMRRAFEAARAAAPDAVLLLNDYNLESKPAKRRTFMRLAETLLKAGAPLTGLGTQSHLVADLAPGAVTTAINELATLGLPIHVSELDISINWAEGALVSRDEWRERQRRLAGEIGEAFARLPSDKRLSFTVWGLRDADSWLRSPKENPHPPWDEPLFFNDAGQPKPMLANLERGLSV